MSDLQRILEEGIQVSEHPYAKEARVLTKEDIEAAIEKVREVRPPCGTPENLHVVHPRAVGWTTCANCFGPVYVGER